MDTKKLLIIEDSETDLLVLSHTLGLQYRLAYARSAEEAVESLSKNNFDLILLDISLPGLDGLNFCRRIRNMPSHQHTPIIFVSGRQTVEDRVEGLRAGADDFVTKPFAVPELLARIEACLRRSQRNTKPQDVIACGPFVLDYQKHSLIYKIDAEDLTCDLTSTELKLISYFLKRPNVVCTREQIIKEVWGTEIHVLERTVDARVNSIRKKMGPYSNLLNAVHGVGYKLSVSPMRERAS